jgi:DNA-binding NarL/FixJ family response regulator
MHVLICDDQAMIRDGLKMLLSLERDIEVVGVAADGRQAVDLTNNLAPDIVLMDLKMPGMNGVEATRQILRQHPQIKVLVLTTYDQDTWLFEALRVGAAGYLLKDSPRDDLVKALRGTLEGKVYIDPGVAGKLLGQLAPRAQPTTALATKLSEREFDVLRLIAQGLSNARIAERLHLSEGTVRNNVSAVLAKLQVSDRTQAALLAVQHGLGESAEQANRGLLENAAQ